MTGHRTRALALLLSLPTFASAQLSGGESGPTPAGGRPETTRIGFFELLKSGGEAFVELFAAPTGGEQNGPEWDGNTSPRESVMTFVTAMGHVAEGREDELSRAKKSVPEGYGRDQMLDLLYVFDRLPDVSPGSVPGEDEMRAREATRFELFPRGIERSWAYTALDGGLKGDITLEKTDDGAWRFTEDTMSGAADLLEAMRPIPPRPRIKERGKVFKEIVGPTFTQTPWSGWLYLLGALAIAGAAAWLSWKALTKAASWLSDKGDYLVAPLLSGLKVPLTVVLLTIGFLAGTARVTLTPTLENFRWTLVETLLVLAGTWLFVILIEIAVFGLRKFLGQSDDDPYVRMATNVFRQALRVVVGAALLLFVLRNVFEWDVTALIGGVGLLALAMSLAAKDAVANLFGAATIFFSRPFLTGDWIIFQKKIGVVEDVTLQNTSVRLLTGEVWSVPNMLFVDTPVENLSRRRYLRRVMELGVRYDTPPQKLEEAIEILEDVLSSDPVVGDGKGDVENHPPKVNFVDFEDSSLKIRADYWYLMHHEESDMQRHTDRGYLTWLEHCSTVNTLVLKRFNEAGIGFAFPSRTLYLEGGDSEVVPVRLHGESEAA